MSNLNWLSVFYFMILIFMFYIFLMNKKIILKNF